MSEELKARITAYLSGGGLFNPELADHEAVRDLLIDCRAALQEAQSLPELAVIASRAEIASIGGESFMRDELRGIARQLRAATPEPKP